MKQVKTPEDVPNGKHYAVIIFRKVTEDSGWGSENNSQVLAPEYFVSEDQTEWADHIKTLEKKRLDGPYGSFAPYVALVVEGKAQIQYEVKVT